MLGSTAKLWVLLEHHLPRSQCNRLAFECYRRHQRKGTKGLVGKGRSQQIGQINNLIFYGSPPPKAEVFLRDQPGQVGGSADRINDRAPDCCSTIICHPESTRAQKQALVVATLGLNAEMAQDGHHSVLYPTDIPAGIIVEDRNVDLRTREVH